MTGLYDGLVHYWKFDEASGTAYDAVDSRDLSVTGTVGVVTGKIGNARSFNGDGANRLRNETGFAPGTQCSFSCWFKGTNLTQQNNAGFLINIGNTGTNFRFAFNSSTLHFELSTWIGSTNGLYDGGGDSTYYSTYNDDKWHHCVGVRNGASYKIYIDGVLHGERTNGNTTNYGTYPITVSGNYNYNTQGLNGYLDELMVYDRVLTESEILQLYNNGLGIQYPFYVGGYVKDYADLFKGLVAGYDFRGDAKDFSGNGNDGTVTGATLTTNHFGISNSAYRFDSKSDYISIPPQNSTNISVSMWYYYDGVGTSWNTLLCRAGGEYHHCLIHTDGSGSIGFYNLGFYDSGFDLVQGNWYHITLVKSGTNSKLYINGSLKQDSNSSFDNATYPLAIIGNYGSYTQGSLGVIANVIIINHVLSAEQVNALMDLTKQNFIYPYPQDRRNNGVTQ